MSSTRIYVTTIGILTALIGIFHGIFETLQGNNPTGGVVLENIGAITVIPNYLFTGIAAIIVGLALIFWVFRFIQRKFGPLIFLLLSIFLFLVGGGVALLVGVLITGSVSIQLNQPLDRWKRALSPGSRKWLSGWWPVLLGIGLFFLIIGIGIWLVLLPPGDSYKNPVIEYFCWSFLGIGFLFQALIIISGFARDIENHKAGSV